MNWNLTKISDFEKATIIFFTVVFFFASTATISAQKKFTRTYPASKNVRLQLTNRTGTVTVEGWEKSEISISAYMETPAANM